MTVSTGQPYAGTYPDPLDANTFAGDPRVVYDHASQRWFACALDFGSGHALLAVSTNSDPVGTNGAATWISNQWKHYLLPIGLFPTGNIGENNPADSDYTRLGVDGNGVYIVVRHFNNITEVERFAALPEGPFLDGSATRLKPRRKIRLWKWHARVPDQVLFRKVDAGRVGVVA